MKKRDDNVSFQEFASAIGPDTAAVPMGENYGKQEQIKI